MVSLAHKFRAAIFTLKFFKATSFAYPFSVLLISPEEVENPVA